MRLGPDEVPGRIAAIEGPFHRIVFPAWPELEGEWRTTAHLSKDPPELDANRARMVEWKGDWHPALTLARDAGRWKIHYVGFGANWNEVVAPERIRFGGNPSNR